MYGLLGLLPTSGEHVMSIAHLEIYLLRTMVTCSILILPAVYTHTPYPTGITERGPILCISPHGRLPGAARCTDFILWCGREKQSYCNKFICKYKEKEKEKVCLTQPQIQVTFDEIINLYYLTSFCDSDIFVNVEHWLKTIASIGCKCSDL